MRCVFDLRRWGGLALGLTLLWVAAPAAAQLGLAPAQTDPGLEAIGPGFDRWLRETLEDSGLAPSPLPARGLAGLESAASQGYGQALIPELSEQPDGVEIQLQLWVPASENLLVAGTGRAALASIGVAAQAALETVGPALGVRPDAITPPLLEELACLSRALAHQTEGRLFDAWREVAGKLAPTAMALRQEITSQARRPGAPKTERARVLTVAGDPGAAWALVGSRANLEVRKPNPKLALLIAAAEVQLARKNPSSALRFLEVAARKVPDSFDVQLGLGRARQLQNDPVAARRAFQRAAKLDPDDPRPLAGLLAVDADSPSAVARHQLQAGRLAVTRLEADRARSHLRETGRLDASLAGESALVEAQLEARLGRPAEALVAYRRAVEAGFDGASTWSGIGQAQRRLGEPAAAEKSLRRAVKLDPENGPALTELGALLTQSERPAEAVPLLRRAHEIQPNHGMSQLALARALRLSGADSDAVEILMSGGSLDDVRRLRELARAQLGAGDPTAARDTLSRAVRLRPQDSALREQLAASLEATGDASAAANQRAMALQTGPREPEVADEPPAPERTSIDFDALVLSFAAGVSRPSTQRVALLAPREPEDPRSWLRRLTRLREPDDTKVEESLRASIAERFDLMGFGADELHAIETYIEPVFDFESPSSLSAENIARLNSMLGTHGIFVARILSHPQDRETIECEAGTFALETRLLLGSEPKYVDILTASDCVAGGLAVYGRPNAEGLVALGALVLFLGFPLLRGWGNVVVRIQLPDKTKGFFSIFITTKPDQVRKELVDKKTGREKLVAKRNLDILRRFRKHMAGRETTFRMIPARAGDYIVTVGGPLLDARGKQIVGHFLEEQKLRVRRNDETELLFDFRPRECAIEVKVTDQGGPAENARVALAGDPSSLRYAREGQAYLYVGKGEHTIRVGSKQAAAEFRVHVENLDNSVSLSADLSDQGTVFSDCPDAVEPFLIGDFATAVNALEAAGDQDAAHRLRAELLEQQGRSGDAAQELEAAGRLEEAATLRASDADHAGSASLYEKAGEDAKAAEAYRAAGNFEQAAQCFERLYDYGNALECWREVGDEEREIDLLEKLGEYFDAAELARNRGELDRAIHDLQQVDQRHPRYQHACRLIAEVVSERGDHELAIAKFEESFGEVGLEGAALDALESYAGTLERAGRTEDALSTYEIIRRRDVERSDVSTRIQELRSRIDASPSQATTQVATQATPNAAPAETRYELLEEIGRGGMGVVYKAQDKRLGRIVALKRLPENLRQHPSAIQLFEREARAAAALNHVNIVTLFDAGEEDGAYFITMELLEGRALNDILHRQGSLSARDTARIGIQVAAGLHCAHSQRIVHRDIKTSNLFFTRDQVVKIMDFGIAKSLEEMRRSTTVVGGTPYYMAPEQATGQGVDHRTDLYAFGVTLFQLLTGTLPFKDGDVTYQHANQAPPDPREIEASIPEAMAALILQLMAKCPEDRPADAAEVAERLRTTLG